MIQILKPTRCSSFTSVVGRGLANLPDHDQQRSNRLSNGKTRGS